MSTARKKANQDSYYCETHFAGDDQKAFFAVFDGHGQFGDICSQFSAEYVSNSCGFSHCDAKNKKNVRAKLIIFLSLVAYNSFPRTS